MPSPTPAHILLTAMPFGADVFMAFIRHGHPGDQNALPLLPRQDRLP